MGLLQKRVVKDGQIEVGNILKVDSFLNHQIGVSLLEEVGEEFHRQLAGQTVNKILTIEASGIAIVRTTARCFQAPVVSTEKTRPPDIAGDVCTAEVKFFTHKNINNTIVSERLLSPGNHILIIDDPLANGKAILGLAELVEQAGTTLVGTGVAIERSFQDDGRRIREVGINLHFLATIEEMDTERGIHFHEETL